MLAILGVLVALGTLGVAGLSPQTPPWLVHALLALFGACAIGWNGVYLAEVARRAPSGMASGATAGALVFTYSGMVLGPAAFALVMHGFGSYRLAFALLAIPAVVCAIVLLRPCAKGEDPRR